MKTSRITIHIKGLDDDGKHREINYDLTDAKYALSFNLVQTKDYLEGESNAEPWARKLCATGQQRLELNVGLMNKEDALACTEFSAKHRNLRHVAAGAPDVIPPHSSVLYDPPLMTLDGQQESFKERAQRHAEEADRARGLKIVSTEERNGVVVPPQPLDQGPDTTKEMQDLVKQSRVEAAKEYAEIPIAAHDETISSYGIPNSLVNVLRAIIGILYPTVSEKFATKFCLDLVEQKLNRAYNSEELVGVEKLVQLEWKHLSHVR
jgi:hypothetical protein